jgi:acetylglutamate kinase
VINVAILEERPGPDRAAEIRQAQKIKSGMPRTLKSAIHSMARNPRDYRIADDLLQTLIAMKLAEKKLGRVHLTPMGRIVSMV